MSPYRIMYTHRSDRDRNKLSSEISLQVIQRIHEIREEPYRFIKKIKGSNPRHPVYSLRIRRDIRAFLSIHDVQVIHFIEVE